MVLYIVSAALLVPGAIWSWRKMAHMSLPLPAPRTVPATPPPKGVAELILQPTEPDPEPVFDPELCASLHNQIMAYAAKADWSSDPDRLERHRFVDGEWSVEFPGPPAVSYTSLDALRARIGDDLVRFFELIDVPRRWPYPEPVPFAFAPDVSMLWNFHEDMTWLELEHLDNVVLLYVDAGNTNYGGLFFDLVTKRAHWLGCRHVALFRELHPSIDEWIPLDQVLRRWLNMWKEGVFDREREDDEKEEPPGLSAELDRSVAAWHRLLDAIESRAPPDAGGGPFQFEPMVTHQSAKKYRLPPFMKRFFERARAPRPGIRFIAPGLETFTDDTFVEFQERWEADITKPEYKRYAELAARARKGQVKGEDRLSRVLFPAQDFAQIASGAMREDWRYTYLESRCGGLYFEDDGATMVSHLGTTDAFSRGQLCPWAPRGRRTHLSEVLGVFENLVQHGVWEIGEKGVMGDFHWFDVEYREWFTIPLDHGSTRHHLLDWGPSVDY